MAERPTTNVDSEAQAFDHQIDERIAHGHVPDLRRAVPCDWFRNNSWRHPEYVALDFGEQFALIRDALLRHAPGDQRARRVLEVGCGPGYLSLELARAGFDVTGVDVSGRCIAVAERFAREDPFAAGRGPLRYLTTDLLRERRLDPRSFDAVIFLGSLHHFEDQETILLRAGELLGPGGICIAHEPARDRVTKGNAMFVHLVRVLLSAGGGFHQPYGIPADPASAQVELEQLHAALRYQTEEGHKVQSPNDNDAGYAQMHPALARHFQQLEFRWRYAFFHDLIGGLRFPDQVSFALARYLRDMDAQLCAEGVLSATEFFFVGRRAPQARE
jgi:2-polyprenyl-3-methyl-5-hydroxy-6-metoxy-1,4-benzoquinol methylase